MRRDLRRTYLPATATWLVSFATHSRKIAQSSARVWGPYGTLVAVKYLPMRNSMDKVNSHYV